MKKPEGRYGSIKLKAPKPRIDIYKTSLAYLGTTLWNKLPTELKKITSCNTFKKRLFIHLIKKHQN